MTRWGRPVVHGDGCGGDLRRAAHGRVVMKRDVLKYGFLSGVVVAVAMGVTVPFEHHIGARWAMAIGYTIMVLSFLIVFVGVKHYRDTELGGFISFGRALAAGVLMMLIACGCYVAMWEALSATVEKNFAAEYSAGMEKRARASGLQGAALEAKLEEIRKFQATYSNPFYRMAMTLLEPLPVGLVMALVSAGILRRRRVDGVSRAAGSAALAS
jgi:Protein of unknown function (DUF4199)